MSKYYYHGIREDMDMISTCYHILLTGEIRCKRLLALTSDFGFNRRDYVSLCKKEKQTEYQSHVADSFHDYIYNHFCFIISDQVDAIKPTVMENLHALGCQEILDYLAIYPNRQFTDQFDEWQVKDKISLSEIVGIGIPCHWVLEESSRYTLEELSLFRKILEISTALGLDIVDSSEKDFIEKYETEKLHQHSIKAPKSLKDWVGNMHE